MKAWNLLMDQALIGTDKKKLDSAAVLPAIRDFLTAGTESQRLLDAASLTHFYEKGVVQAQNAPANSTIDITEELPVATPELQTLLQDILFVEYNWSADLLSRWIDVVAAGGYRVNPVQLTRLLQGIEKGKLAIGEQQVFVLGAIGKYVAQNFDLLNPAVFLTQEAYLQEAPLAAIKTYIHRLRKKERTAFVSCLHQYWGSFSLPDQLSWVQLMRDHPSDEEVAFARQLWENDFPPKQKETVNYTRLRSALATILLSRKTEPFHSETVEALQKYCIRQSKGFFTKLLKSGPEKTIEIPVVEDDFLNETVFHERFGLLLDSKIKVITEERLPAYFRHLIAILPFETWTELLEASAAQVFDYFKTDKSWQRLSGGQNTWELADAFHELAAFTDNETFLLLFGTMSARINAQPLLRLPAASLEKVLAGSSSDIDLHDLVNLFQDCESRDFSLEFAGYVLQKSWQHYQQAHFYKPTGVEHLFSYMPVQVLPELEKLLYHTGDSPGKTQWMQDIGISLQTYIKLKQRIEKPGL